MSFVTVFRRPPTRQRTTAAGDPTTGAHPERGPDDDAAGNAAGEGADDGAGVREGAGKHAAGAGGVLDAASEGAGEPADDAGGLLDDVAGGAGAKHRLATCAKTALAAVIVFGALVGPDDITHRTPGVFVRIPVEGLVAAAVLLVLPARARRAAAVVAGMLLGLLTLLKIVDIGFYTALDRPFDLVLDWILLGPAVGVLRDSVGGVGATGAVIGAGLLVAVALVLAIWSVLRLTGLMVRNNATAIRALALLAVGWLTCAGFGAQVVPGVPVASRSEAALVRDRVLQVRAGLHDKRAFAQQAAVDPFRDTSGSELLAGLRGKDVVLTFVESYGRDAVQDPEFATQVGKLLDAGTRRLAADGYAARSAFLTSPAAGGGSWLAHATLQSGLWIKNQQRYRTLVSSDRLTLTGAFKRAGWRTVSVEPAISGAWPEGTFYGYDKDYNSGNLGFRGPRLSYATMPDQYTFSAFERSEHGVPGHAPLMAQITLVSSHTPWTPLPRRVDWDDVGDGSVFGPMAGEGESASVLWKSGTTRIRAAYRQSIEYSLSTLISYVQTYGDDDLVLVFLGDHQPAPIVTGARPSRDVPITIVARDKAVLDRISGWGWTPGLRPGPRAPAWRMSSFRDRFLTAFAR